MREEGREKSKPDGQEERERERERETERERESATSQKSDAPRVNDVQPNSQYKGTHRTSRTTMLGS